MAREPRRRRPAIIEDSNATEGVVINALRVGLALNFRLEAFCQRWGITILQFNVLRILYVRDPEFRGVPSGALAERVVVISRAPDVPRLIDRLVKSGLVERRPSPDDRRVVLVRLTQKGVDLIEEVNEPLLDHNRRLLDHMSVTELRETADLLRRVYSGPLSQPAADDEDAEDD